MIINLLKSLYNQSPKLSAAINYKQLQEDIEFFSISPQINYLLKKHELLKETPLAFQEKLKQNCTKVFYQNLFIKTEWEKLASLFDEQKVATIPLKGITFAEKYFGSFGARSTSDIDLLVQQSNVNKATQLIESLGFRLEEEQVPSHFHCSFSKNLPNSSLPLTIELHWNIMRNDTASLKIDDFWNEAVRLPHYQFIYELSDYHTFYMICLHGWRHNLNSLKYFLDIIQLLDVIGDKVDYSRLFQDATTHHTYTRMLRTLSIVYDLFPQLQTIKPFNLHKSTPFWKYDNIRYPKKRNLIKYVDFLDYQFFSFDKVKHSISEMRNLLTNQI